METETLPIPKNYLSFRVLLEGGLIVFLVAALIQLGAWQLDLMGSLWYGSISFLLLLGLHIFVGIRASKSLNQEEHPAHPVWRNLVHLLLILVISFLLLGMLDFLQFKVIDPEAFPRAFEQMEQSTLEMMEKFGSSEEDMDKASEQFQVGRDRFRSMDFLGYMGNRFSSGILFVVVFFIIALVSGLRKIRRDSSVKTGIY